MKKFEGYGTFESSEKWKNAIDSISYFNIWNDFF